jgi:hypothetical protein
MGQGGPCLQTAIMQMAGKARTCPMVLGQQGSKAWKELVPDSRKGKINLLAHATHSWVSKN